jgi:hypothetical protein
MTNTAFVTGGTGFIGVDPTEVFEDNHDWLVEEGLLASSG